MADPFDIYQTDAGYAAVTSPIQRQILDALRAGEKQLPELVEITGRSKPTLSSLHMKELLGRELIEEIAHPTDSRRKVYRLRGSKIGSSELPVSQLKEAIQHYVSLSPLASRVPLASALEAIAAAPPKTPPEVLQAQAANLGRAASALFKVATVREMWLSLTSLLEAEGIASTVRMDLEAGTVELRLGAAIKAEPKAMAAALAGFAEGIAAERGLGLQSVIGRGAAGGVRLTAR